MNNNSIPNEIESTVATVEGRENTKNIGGRPRNKVWEQFHAGPK